MFSKILVKISYLLLFATLPHPAFGNDSVSVVVIDKMFDYRSTIPSSIEGHTTTAYLKYKIRTDKRNSLLYLVPDFYTFMRTDRLNNFGESLVEVTYHEGKSVDFHRIVRTSTLRRHRKSVPNLETYLTVSVYNPTIFEDHVLSPFHRDNKKVYNYHLINISDSICHISIVPRVLNTQTVRGDAMIDMNTGRVVSCTLLGEFDMVAYELAITFGESGVASLLPSHCILNSKLTIAGNKLRGIYDATFNLGDLSVDGLDSLSDREKMSKLRPNSLTEDERAIYAEYDSLTHRPVTVTELQPKRKFDFTKDILWDVFGENLIKRIRGNFADGKGYFKISPLVNPFYISYSRRKGITYKFSARGGYTINDNSDIYVRTKVGYSFKLRQLMVDIPATFTFNNRRNGYIKYHFSTGQPVTNSSIVERLKAENPDSINFDAMDLDYFKQSRSHLEFHYDLDSHFSFAIGTIWSRWKSIKSKHFDQLKKSTKYHATSLLGTATYRPWGWKGPVITLDYERTINKLSRNHMNFEKWELDYSHIYHLSCLRSLSLRGGAGLYTSSIRNTYFLDFNNFRDTNIPEGWNDEWSGEFELLHTNWYNSSQYYIRSNITYESPLLFLAHLPFVGKVIETERLYFSALRLERLSNYVEVGYGFTNRLFSVGFFTSFKRGSFEGFGCKFDLEMFRKW